MKVKLGIKNLHVNPCMIDAETGAVTWGESKEWPGTVSLNVEKKSEASAIYADDEAYFLAESSEGAEIELETLMVPEWFDTEVLGNKIDSNGNIVEIQGGVKKPISIAFEFTGDTKAVRHRYYYCQPSDYSESGKTKADKVEGETTKVKLKAMPVPGSEGIVKTKTADKTTTEAYDAWYTGAVTLPTFQA